MCILFISVDPNPKKGTYRLILATNRDEHYKRPAKIAHIDKNAIIGGRDMEPGREGGTWLAFRTKDTEKGKKKKHCVGVLLNVSGEKIENPCGRGQIITDYLLTDKTFPEYVDQLEKVLYNGYNFVSVEIGEDDNVVYHHSNFPTVSSSYNGRHILGFGNSPIFTPLAKVTKGRNKFQTIIEANMPQQELIQELLKLLKDDTRLLPDDELERRQPLAYESLSSIFIKLGKLGYGTRTHTVILVDYDWNLTFIEHTMKEPIDISTPTWTETVLNVKL